MNCFFANLSQRHSHVGNNGYVFRPQRALEVARESTLKRKNDKGRKQWISVRYSSILCKQSDIPNQKEIN